MRHIVICGLPRSAVFSTFPQKDTNFEKKLLNMKCVFWFSLQQCSEKFRILRRILRCMIKNVYWYSWEVPLFFSDFNESWIFSTGFKKVFKYKISWNSVQWELIWSMYTDKLTDMTKITVSFRNIAKAPKNCDITSWTDQLRTPNRKVQTPSPLSGAYPYPEWRVQII